MRVQKNRNLGLNWDADTTGGFFANYFLDPRRARKVTITFSDDQVFKFEARMNPEAQFGAPITAGTVVYQPTDDTHATLESIGGDDVSVAGSVPGSVDLIDLGTGGVYNPTLFRLTTREGTVMIVSETDGLLSLTDRNGNGLTIDGNGVIHSSGKSVVFTRESQNRITHVTDPNGEQLVYYYDASDNLLTETQWVTAPDGMVVQAVTSYTYDEFNNLLSITDANGDITSFEYDGAGNMGRMIDGEGFETLFGYDGAGNITSMTDAEGNVNDYTYDADGNQLSMTVTDAFGTVLRSESYTYDTNGNQLSRLGSRLNIQHLSCQGRIIRNRMASCPDR